MTMMMRTKAMFLILTLLAPGGRAIAQDEEPAGDPCRECFQASRSAAQECREAGGSFLECTAAARDALAACREANACDADRPERPAPCGIECFASAREAVSQCRADGGSLRDCIRAYADAVRTCREEAGCGTRPEPPERCGAECFGAARDAFRACREGDGSFRECVGAFLAALGTCREEAGCDGNDEEEQDAAVEALIAGGPQFVRGDANDDGSVDISDAARMLGYLFQGRPAPPCMDAADFNDDGAVDISDPTALLHLLFIGDESSTPPSFAPVVDWTFDDLGCGEI